jgi:signal transduction histidine kinase
LGELAGERKRAAGEAGPTLPLPGPFRRLAEAHPVWMDLIVAACFLVVSMASALTPVEVEGDGDPALGHWFAPLLQGAPDAAARAAFAAYWVLAVAALVAWRRPHPIWLLAGAIVLDSLIWATIGLPDQWLVLFALFAVAQRASARAAWIGLAVTCADLVAMTWLLGGGTPADPSTIPVLALYTVVVSVFVHLGNRRRYVAALVDRAEHLALERDQRAQIAVADERARIARELHDVVAHSVAVMVTLSDGAQAAVGRQPERAREAMAMVSRTGRQAVADMRRLLAVLRTESDLVPQPGVPDLVPLVDSFKQSGMPVTLELAAAFPDHQALGLTIYRVVQESLTNVLRHAGRPEWVRVAITQPSAQAYRVLVENGPPTRPDEEPAGQWDGSGQGLVGMAQRVAVFGGQLEAGPTAAGGWRVVATVEEEVQDGADQSAAG